MPILCIGESTREDDVWYLHAVKSQLEECLKDVKASELKSLVIAYEPLWAIGKDAKRVATPIESEEMAIYIRKCLPIYLVHDMQHYRGLFTAVQ